jgi:hypothetical protein
MLLGEQQDTIDPEAAILVTWRMTEGLNLSGAHPVARQAALQLRVDGVRRPG